MSGVCFAFQRGECERGNSCRFSHEGGGGGGGGGGGNYILLLLLLNKFINSVINNYRI